MYYQLISLVLTLIFIWTIRDSSNSVQQENQELPDEYNN